VIVTLLLRLITEAAKIVVDLQSQQRSLRPDYHETTTAPLRCEECNAEPWVVRWGAIRIGQELDGYYSLATTGATPRLVCRSCWYRALGVEDPATPRTTHK